MNYISRLWETEANCLGKQELFEKVNFLGDEKTTKEDETYVSEAKRTCMSCPVRKECLDDAMRQEHYLNARTRAGIRGGLDAGQRAQLATKRDHKCARCGVTSISPTKRLDQLSVLCGACSLYLNNRVDEKYFAK